MSTMLEQAIIDAAALKEAAIKNAETAVIEKYSDNIKEAVESLLEEGDLALDELGGDEEEGGGLGDLGGAGDEAGVAPADAITDATPAIADGESLCPCPEAEEEITIDFNQLAAAVDKEEDAMEAGEGIGALDDLGGPPDDLGFGGEEEEIELEEETLNSLIGEIAEELKVDHKPQPTGTTGGITNNVVAEEEEDAAIAAQRDDETAEELKQAKKAVKDLQEQVQAMTENKNKYVQVVNYLKEKLEETNLSNAKLLYTNKILNSGSLNERQIEKVVGAITKAKTVQEAKVIYETLQSAVDSTRSKRRAPKSLSEAIQKRSSAFMPRKETPAQEVPTELNRWHILAGLKKK